MYVSALITIYNKPSYMCCHQGRYADHKYKCSTASDLTPITTTTGYNIDFFTLS